MIFLIFVRSRSGARAGAETWPRSSNSKNAGAEAQIWLVTTLHRVEQRVILSLATRINEC
jgi:hypothetical protein